MIPEALLPLLHRIADYAGMTGLYIVGGFVRDLLIGKPRLELDLVLEEDAIAFVRALVARYGGQMQFHDPFRTATWYLPEDMTRLRDGAHDVSELPTVIDFATTRVERYTHPAALPTVTPVMEPGALTRDLARRDFTINTLAIRLSPPPFGKFVDLHDGLNDLQAGIIRILHDQSFIDDPTRIFRAARFAARFDFHFDPRTEALITPALPHIADLSGERVTHEFDLIFREDRPEKALHLLQHYGVLASLPGNIRIDPDVVSAFSMSRLWLSEPHWKAAHNPPADLRLIYWVLLGCSAADSDSLITRLTLERSISDRIEAGGNLRRLLQDGNLIHPNAPPSQVTAHFEEALRPIRHMPEESLIAAWALTRNEANQDLLVQFADRWRYTKPVMNGYDLQQMGLRRGPRLGKLLARLRNAVIDGLVDGPEAERAALERWISEDQSASPHPGQRKSE